MHPARAAGDSLRQRCMVATDKLESLVAMAPKDSLVKSIATGFLWHRDSAAWPRPEAERGITGEGGTNYRRLFRKIGLGCGLDKDIQGNIYFISHGISILTGTEHPGSGSRRIE